ncbi:hypothetical protein [Rubripirellula reticaptiva]|uniref:Uncharacterized protein n=1 Tax=Rubripirellula reticaptiva TaxID=2528013 RepID=A0A5C6F185_9BACT|nr:hypothetical protein [Rubripirellula reticaptiva]TWU55118.1 hypothetical protein Poly59_14140 [Rubripirellula reticaptiva]
MNSDEDYDEDEFDEDDTGDDDFDYDAFVEDNFESKLTNTETKPLWRLVAVVLLIAVVGAAVLQVMAMI